MLRPKADTVRRALLGYLPLHERLIIESMRPLGTLVLYDKKR
jgi:hypothetical protein